MTATVNAKTVRAILGVAKAAGIDAGAFARAHGVAEAMTDVDARFPHTTYIALWEEVIQRTNRDAIGIEAAEGLPWGHWDVIDYLIGTSDTFGTAIERFSRYFAIISTGALHTVEREKDTVRIVRRYPPDCQTRLRAPADFAFTAIVAHMRIAVGFRWCPREVTFAAAAPASDAIHRRFFGCSVRFEATGNAIVFDASALSLPIEQHDSELGRVLERHAESLVRELMSPQGERDFVSQVRRVIVNGLPDADVSITRTARQVGVSVRTLQRRLQEGGMTFDDLYDNVRRDLARRYLHDPALSIQETAHLLAFGDLRGFYRAFKRWEGRTPADYRKSDRVSRSVGTPRP